MKTVFSIATVVAVCCMIAAQAPSAAKAPDEAAQVAAEVTKMFTVSSEATKLTSAALAKVTDGVVYNVKVTIKGPDSRQSSRIKVIKEGKSISKLDSPSTNQSCPGLKKMIRKEFTLKTEQDAKVLEAALDELYPISDSFGGRDKKAKAIKRDGANFIFVRGVFFKKLKGFIVETDGKGAITDVKSSLQIEK